ncbi:MAG: MerR family transcriptional regulator [Paracoccaceae bacterium]
MRTNTIGDAARLAGVGVETIRFYERKGLIKQPPRPRGGGFRQYTDEIVRQLCFVRQAQALGFSLKEIDVLLNLRADPGTDCKAVQIRASDKLVEVENKIAQLRIIGEALRDVIAACPLSGGLEGCSIIAAMETHAADQG